MRRRRLSADTGWVSAEGLRGVRGGSPPVTGGGSQQVPPGGCGTGCLDEVATKISNGGKTMHDTKMTDNSGSAQAVLNYVQTMTNQKVEFGLLDHQGWLAHKSSKAGCNERT